MPYTRRQIKRLLDPELIPAAEITNERARLAETVVKRGVFAVEDRTVRNLEALYRATRRDLRDAAENTAARLGIGRLEANRQGQQWRQLFNSQLEAQLNRLIDSTAAEALRGASVAWYGGYYGKAWLLNTATSGNIMVRRPDAGEVARYLAGLVGVREDVYEDTIRSLLGNEWRDLFKNEIEEVAASIKKSIWQGMQAGEGIPDIMKRVESALGAFSKEGYKANFNRVQAITRTVVNQASNNGAVQVLREHPGIVQEYEWLTAKDERVCPTCRGLNGTRYPINDFYRPPAHPNCRCTILPVVTYLELPTNTMPTLNEWAMGLGLNWFLKDFYGGTKQDSDRWGNEDEYEGSD